MRCPIIIFIYLLAAIPCQARIITVDDDDPADFNNIQVAINDSNDGDTILVADGTYYETLQMKDGVNVFGAGADVTTIDGGAIGHVLVFISASGSISGFTITNSSPTDHYAGIHVSNSTVSIKNNIITGNQFSIRILNNSNGIITGNKVIGNSCGISIHDSNMSITNNLVALNPWLGISFKGGSASIINNTITGVGWSAGINCASPTSTHVIANNIITQNNTGIRVHGGLFGSAVPMLNISYNNVWGNYNNYWEQYGDPEWGYSGPFTPKPGTGQISQDPLFADPNNADCHLQSQTGRWDPNQNQWVTDVNTSPCIDSGAIGSDWAAELWPHGKQINMGAYGGTPQASMSLSDTGNIADLNNDGSVDYLDMILFTNKWPYCKTLLPEDLDRNGFVDFIDFAIFSYNWRWKQ